jgi:hypothetical protein
MAELMTDGWAQQVFALLQQWPDQAERDQERKSDNYWRYYERKRETFNGTFALGIRGIPGADGVRYLAISYDGDGNCSGVAVVSEAAALAQAKLAMECDYQTWRDMAGGYDISKAMTYHKLPLTVGTATELLRCVYFVHELITAALRPRTGLPEPAAA